MIDREKDPLEKLQKNLYSRTPKTGNARDIPPLRPSRVEVKDDWVHEESGKEALLFHPRRSLVTKYFLVFSLVFFVIALALSFFIYYRGANVFSPNNINITITAPVSVPGGEVLPIEIKVDNRNNTTLEDSDLRIEYPEGSRDPENVTLDKRRETFSLSDLAPGISATRNTSVVFFGEEREVKKVKAILEYRVKNSSAIYEKVKEFDVTLSSSPVTIKVESLKEINSGQDIDFDVTVVSNSAEVLENILFEASYGFGFGFKDATPKPAYGNNVWKISRLKPGEEIHFKIRGSIQGEEGEERTFRFSAGLPSKEDEKKMNPVFLTSLQAVSLKKPFIAMSVLLNGESGQIYPAKFGESIQTDIYLENAISASISNVRIEAKLSGKFDPSSVEVIRGFFRSSDNTIIWNPSTQGDLETLDPKSGARVSFSFEPLNPEASDIPSFRNPEVSISVSAEGERREESQVPQKIVLNETKKARMQSNLALESKLLRTQGPFQNTGPIPPEADKETTYTVTWSVYNNVNDVRDVIITGALPPYVKWLKNVSPAEDVTYNPSQGIITWRAGEFKARSGAGAAKEVSFQVSFLPSVTQIDTVPVLLGNMTITGVDRFTESTLRGSAPDLTTRFESDPSYRSGDDEVED